MLDGILHLSRERAVFPTPRPAMAEVPFSVCPLLCHQVEQHGISRTIGRVASGSQCPECGTGFRIFQATNPKNGEQMAIMIPRE